MKTAKAIKMVARFDGKCAYCWGEVRANETRIEYRPEAPKGSKVVHEDCNDYAELMAAQVRAADEADARREEEKRNPTALVLSRGEGYPYGEWVKAVTSCETVDQAAAANLQWSRLGWTLDYVTEFSRSVMAQRDSERLIALIGFLTGVRA